MNHSAPDQDASTAADDRLARLLAYRSPLDGSAFLRSVHAVGRRRRRQRFWLMGGAVLAATTSAALLRPQQFDVPPVLAGLFEQTTQMASGLPLVPMAAVLAAIALCLGASRAIDNI